MPQQVSVERVSAAEEMGPKFVAPARDVMSAFGSSALSLPATTERCVTLTAGEAGRTWVGTEQAGLRVSSLVNGQVAQGRVRADRDQFEQALDELVNATSAFASGLTVVGLPDGTVVLELRGQTRTLDPWHGPVLDDDAAPWTTSAEGVSGQGLVDAIGFAADTSSQERPAADRGVEAVRLTVGPEGVVLVGGGAGRAGVAGALAGRAAAERCEAVLDGRGLARCASMHVGGEPVELLWAVAGADRFLRLAGMRSRIELCAVDAELPIGGELLAVPVGDRVTAGSVQLVQALERLREERAPAFVDLLVEHGGLLLVPERDGLPQDAGAARVGVTGWEPLLGQRRRVAFLQLLETARLQKWRRRDVALHLGGAGGPVTISDARWTPSPLLPRQVLATLPLPRLG